MCGIAGIVALAPSPCDAEQTVRAMTAALAHRGPDGAGLYRDDYIALGHRRLSIIDPARGDQPMQSGDGRHVLAFNGEVYNHAELAGQLRARGKALRSASDTEVLLEWLAWHGRDGLRAVHGMFALAFWDRTARTLLLARDRAGEKPLFYGVAASGFAFASELRALRRAAGVDTALRQDMLPAFLAFGYIPAPATIHRGLHKLEPGSWLEWSERGMQRGAYWERPQPRDPFTHPEEALPVLRAALRDAVHSRLRSEAPLGIWLSGGLDSALVTALAAAHSPAGPPPTFSMSFDEPSHDETRYAKQMAAHCGTTHHVIPLQAHRVAELVPAALDCVGEPFADASILPTFLLARETARSVKVVLGGDGGDELFGGYPAFAADRLARVPGVAATARLLAGLWPESENYASPAFLLRHFVGSIGEEPGLRFLSWLGPMSVAQASRLLPGSELRPALRAALGPAPAGLLSSLCLRTYLQDGILVKTDRAGMAASLEVRAPLLDHRLIELAARIPEPWKFRRGRAKWLLKQAARGFVPEPVLRRRKAGFMMPLARYLRGPLRPLVEELCDPRMVRQIGLLDPGEVDRLRSEHLSGRADHRKSLWAVLALQHWALRG